ncbi:hypothetical protein BGX27_005677 [Mortierella sp. AM989]|nr:hypothetical protein BGX27_005677 [Mortierella sp. AM989]
MTSYETALFRALGIFEIWLEICNYLTLGEIAAAIQVCQAWHMSLQARILRDVYVSFVPINPITPDILKPTPPVDLLKKYSHEIRSLTIVDRPANRSEIEQFSLDGCTRLERFSWTSAGSTPGVYATLHQWASMIGFLKRNQSCLRDISVGYKCAKPMTFWKALAQEPFPSLKSLRADLFHPDPELAPLVWIASRNLESFELNSIGSITRHFEPIYINNDPNTNFKLFQEELCDESGITTSASGQKPKRKASDDPDDNKQFPPMKSIKLSCNNDNSNVELNSFQKNLCNEKSNAITSGGDQKPKRKASNDPDDNEQFPPMKSIKLSCNNNDPNTELESFQENLCNEKSNTITTGGDQKLKRKASDDADDNKLFPRMKSIKLSCAANCLNEGWLDVMKQCPRLELLHIHCKRLESEMKEIHEAVSSKTIWPRLNSMELQDQEMSDAEIAKIIKCLDASHKIEDRSPALFDRPKRLLKSFSTNSLHAGPETIDALHSGGHFESLETLHFISKYITATHILNILSSCPRLKSLKAGKIDAIAISKGNHRPWVCHDLVNMEIDIVTKSLDSRGLSSRGSQPHSIALGPLQIQNMLMMLPNNSTTLASAISLPRIEMQEACLEQLARLPKLKVMKFDGELFSSGFQKIPFVVNNGLGRLASQKDQETLPSTNQEKFLWDWMKAQLRNKPRRPKKTQVSLTNEDL